MEDEKKRKRMLKEIERLEGKVRKHEEPHWFWEDDVIGFPGIAGFAAGAGAAGVSGILLGGGPALACLIGIPAVMKLYHAYILGEEVRVEAEYKPRLKELLAEYR